MKDGGYFVRFSRDGQDYGEGIVVVQDNTVNGGNYVYIYNAKVTGDTLDLHIAQHNLSIATIFGNIQKFTLQLSIAQNGDSYLLTGAVKDNTGLKVMASIRYLGDVI